MDCELREALLKEYSEVGSNFRLLTDIRFKLLALLPIAAAATAALSFKEGNTGFTVFALSLFGLVATIGLATYNARNDQLYIELVGRAAEIERRLGLVDGAFANRPGAWLKLEFCIFNWKIDHGTGISAIYAASITLWLYGTLVPLLAFGRRQLPEISADRFFPLWINAVALLLAVLITLVGLRLVSDQKERRQQLLRKAAARAVSLANGKTLKQLAEPENRQFIEECMTLSDEKKSSAIVARLEAYLELDQETRSIYLTSNISDSRLAAAQVVALLTNLPPRWLFDCAIDRSGVTAKSKDENRNVRGIGQDLKRLARCIKSKVRQRRS